MTELDKSILLCEKASLVLINEFEKFTTNATEVDLESIDRIAKLSMAYHEILKHFMDNIDTESKRE